MPPDRVAASGRRASSPATDVSRHPHSAEAFLPTVLARACAPSPCGPNMLRISAGWSAAEPVRRPGVEFGRLAGAEDNVVVSEDQTHPAGEGEQPLVPFVRLGRGFAFRRDVDLPGLRPARVGIRVTPRRARSCFSRGPTLPRAAAMAVVVSSTAPFHPALPGSSNVNRHEVIRAPNQGQNLGPNACDWTSRDAAH